MPKATFTLPNGTSVTIEGAPDEVQRLLELYGGAPAPGARKRTTTRQTGKKRAASAPKSDAGAPNISEIVNLVKACDEAEQIEAQILDRTSLVDRTLLPLYIVHEYLGNATGLTSGEVNKITTQLSIPVRQPHASTTLSKTASRYVIGDRVRRRGHPVRYKLSRRGLQYMKSVIAGKQNEE
jgi:hypothetical protein